MLVLTRRPGESLVVGDDIEITICNVRNNQVRIGITAPADVQIYREEIYRKIKKAEQKTSGKDSAPDQNGAYETTADLIVEGLAP